MITQSGGASGNGVLQLPATAAVLPGAARAVEQKTRQQGATATHCQIAAGRSVVQPHAVLQYMTPCSSTFRHLGIIPMGCALEMALHCIAHCQCASRAPSPHSPILLEAHPTWLRAVSCASWLLDHWQLSNTSARIAHGLVDTVKAENPNSMLDHS